MLTQNIGKIFILKQLMKRRFLKKKKKETLRNSFEFIISFLNWKPNFCLKPNYIVMKWLITNTLIFFSFSKKVNYQKRIWNYNIRGATIYHQLCLSIQFFTTMFLPFLTNSRERKLVFDATQLRTHYSTTIKWNVNMFTTLQNQNIRS